MTISESFMELVQTYADDAVAEGLWQELSRAYQSPKRHYHTLGHLDEILQQLEPVKTEIDNWTSLIFAIAYHDIVYSVRKTDNEERSAELAVNRLKSLDVENISIQLCHDQIMATKTHRAAGQRDTEYFIDADMAILGASPERYQLYAGQIRKEYAIYPDFLYRRGRKKMIEDFLSRPRLFTTDHFEKLFGGNARANLRWELQEILS